MRTGRSGSVLLSKAANFFETLLVTFFVIVLIFTYCFRLYIVKGESMESTLIQGDTLIVETIPFSDYLQGDIIIADIDNNNFIIKRCKSIIIEKIS